MGIGAEEKLAEPTKTLFSQRIRVAKNMAAKRVFEVNEASVGNSCFAFYLYKSDVH